MNEDQEQKPADEPIKAFTIISALIGVAIIVIQVMTVDDWSKRVPFHMQGIQMSQQAAEKAQKEQAKPSVMPAEDSSKSFNH